MKLKPYSDELFNIMMKKAPAQSKKYWQPYCGTPHIFLAMFGFLSNNKNDQKYGQIYTKLREILNKYNINGPTFEAEFLKNFPKGECPEGEFTINVDRDYEKVRDNLKRQAVKESRTMDVDDLILELFSDRDYSFGIIISQILGQETVADDLYEDVIKAFKHKVVLTIEEFEQMPGVMTNINKWVKDHPRCTIGLDSSVDKILMCLAGRSIKNAALVGPAGTGKTECVYELAQRINSGNIPEEFKERIIYQLDPTGLISGTRFRGDMEEKLMNILNIIKDHPEIILFIDELHTFVSLGSGTEDSNSCGNMIKPYITRGEIQMIGCTTSEEYTKYILKDKAFARRFHKVLIQEPSQEETIEILKGLLPVETEFFKKECQFELLNKIVELSEKYTLDQANPAKSINMLELAFAYCKVFEDKKQSVNIEDVLNSIKLKYNIFISEDRLKELRKELTEKLLGEDEPLKRVMRNMTTVEKGLYDPEKPMFSMLLAGPTGTGKTETCRIIASKYFGSPENLIKINMGEFSTEMDVSKLCGASSGYIGYDDEPALIKGVREKPSSIVLFDEIEKAHPSVQKVLLNILDSGEMADNKGNRVSFRNTVIVFTTNLGCTKNTGKEMGMGYVKTVKDSAAQDAEILKAIENYFSPEFLGRLDDIVIFNKLSREIIEKLIERERLFFSKVSGLDIEFTKEDIDEIIKEAKIETAGARGVKKAVRKQITLKEIKKMEEEEYEESK